MILQLPLLFRPSVWRNVWIALLRSGRDPQARKLLGRFLIFLVAVAVWLALEGSMFLPVLIAYRWFFVITAITILVLAAAVAVYTHWDARHDEELAERTDPAVPIRIKRAIFREALLLASILIRASSERGMEKELPPEVEVVTRRLMLTRLRARKMLDDLDPELLSLVLAPDGHWTEAQKNRAEQSWESLAVLHHALGLGPLRPLTEPPGYSIGLARQIVEAKFPDKLAILPAWELRGERDTAETFFGRCSVEILTRGEWTGSSPEALEEALAVRAEIDEHGFLGDLMMGAETIGEISSEKLWAALLRSHRRKVMLGLLVRITGGEASPAELRQHVTENLSLAAHPAAAE